MSRCQTVPLRAVPENIIQSYLAEKSSENPDSPRVRLVARMARGSIGRALEYWEGPILERRRQVMETLIRIPSASYPEVLGFSQTWDEDKVQIVDDLQLMLSWYRDIVTVKSESTSSLYNPDYKDELAKLAKSTLMRVCLKSCMRYQRLLQPLQVTVRPRFALAHLFLTMKKERNPRWRR